MHNRILHSRAQKPHVLLCTPPLHELTRDHAPFHASNLQITGKNPDWFYVHRPAKHDQSKHQANTSFDIIFNCIDAVAKHVLFKLYCVYIHKPHRRGSLSLAIAAKLVFVFALKDALRISIQQAYRRPLAVP